MTTSIVFGDNDSVLSSYTLGTNKKLEMSNTSTTGAIQTKLGTDTNATKFAVKNNSGVDLFSVKGDGTVTPTLGASGTNEVSSYALFGQETSSTSGNSKSVDGTSGSGTSLHITGSFSSSSDFSQNQGIVYTGGTTQNFRVRASIAFNADVSSAETYEFFIQKNNVTVATSRGLAGGTGKVTLTLNVNTIVSLATNDKITILMRCLSISGSSDIYWHNILYGVTI